MKDFKLQKMDSSMIPTNDNGIKIKDLIKLIEDNELYEELNKLLSLDDIKEEFIEIKGAQTLYDRLISLKKRFIKFDLESNLKDISFFIKDTFTFNFNNTNHNGYLKSLKLEKIVALPIYSSKRDFFSDLYNMDKYASTLLDNKMNHILKQNLILIKKEKKKYIKKYRIIHNLSDNNFYLRAIISKNRYYNYDINIAFVIGLLTLHEESKKSKIKYEINYSEYNESTIKIFISTKEVTKLEKVGYVRNMIEISNDEIKRKAFRFTAISSIIFNKDDKNKEVYISPKKTSSVILSIKHNKSPENSIKELTDISKTNDIHNELYDDIKSITKIKKPEQIKFLVLKKIEKARREEIINHKKDFIKILDKKANNLIELLDMLNKLQFVVTADIEAREYIRYIIYEALIERK